MKKIILIVTIACYSMYTNAQEMSEKDQKAMMEYATPGKMHELLAKNVGSWDGEMTMWMSSGSKPMKNTGTWTSTMIMGGRYEQSTHTSNFMGMDFNGVSTTGYDNARKVFINTWIDNMGTGIMYSEGVWNEKTKSIEFKGKMTDCTKNKVVDFRQVITWIDDTHQKMEMYMPDPKTGKEFKGLEIVSTKK